ncbi:MAG: dihydropteroate synthase [Pseudomonadota bacterium]
MGVLNITPDSFSDGGRLFVDGRPDLQTIHAAAAAMVEAGAAIIDVGGESTRPGAEPVPEADELARVLPVLEALDGLEAVISVDTSKPAVAAAAVDAGCGLINDVTGLADPAMLDVLANSSAAVCIMHMQGEPRTMQNAPEYDDVLIDVGAQLAERVQRARDAGIADNRLCIDPGFGFGKTLEHNLALLAGLETLRIRQLPLLVGLSRKRMIGALTGAPVEERMAGSIAAAVLAAERGADILRVHDVRETVQALKILEGLRG